MSCREEIIDKDTVFLHYSVNIGFGPCNKVIGQWMWSKDLNKLYTEFIDIVLTDILDRNNKTIDSINELNKINQINEYNCLQNVLLNIKKELIKLEIKFDYLLCNNTLDVINKIIDNQGKIEIFKHESFEEVILGDVLEE